MYHLRIAAWNAGSIRDKAEELRFFLEDYNINIVLLTETWLKPDDEFQIPNYASYRVDRTFGPCTELRSGSVRIFNTRRSALRF